MLYQTRFQYEENPLEKNVSCWKYLSHSRANFPMHCHSFFEIGYVIRGQRYELFNGKKLELEDNTLVFIPPLTAHSIQNTRDTQDMVLQFNQDFLFFNSPALPKGATLVPSGVLSDQLYFRPQSGSRLFSVLSALGEVCPARNLADLSADVPDVSADFSPALDWKIHGLTLTLLSALLEEGLLAIQEQSSNAGDVSRLQPVISRLLSAPEETPDMQDAAQLAHMSYYQFSRAFKEIIGYNYVDYCNLARIFRAEELLLNTDLSVTQIAEQLHFGTVSYFNRLFKKHTGQTPLQYRKIVSSPITDD